MGSVAAIGEHARVAGLGLAGVHVAVAEAPATVRDAWRRLAADVQLVILTPVAAAALADELAKQAEETRLVAVMPW